MAARNVPAHVDEQSQKGYKEGYNKTPPIDSTCGKRNDRRWNEPELLHLLPELGQIVGHKDHGQERHAPVTQQQEYIAETHVEQAGNTGQGEAHGQEDVSALRQKGKGQNRIACYPDQHLNIVTGRPDTQPETKDPAIGLSAITPPKAKSAPATVLYRELFFVSCIVIPLFLFFKDTAFSIHHPIVKSNP